MGGQQNRPEERGFSRQTKMPCARHVRSSLTVTHAQARPSSLVRELSAPVVRARDHRVQGVPKKAHQTRPRLRSRLTAASTRLSSMLNCSPFR